MSTTLSYPTPQAGSVCPIRQRRLQRAVDRLEESKRVLALSHVAAVVTARGALELSILTAYKITVDRSRHPDLSALVAWSFMAGLITEETSLALRELIKVAHGAAHGRRVSKSSSTMFIEHATAAAVAIHGHFLGREAVA